MTKTNPNIRYFKIDVPIYNKRVHFYIGTFNNVKKAMLAKAVCPKCVKQIEGLEDDFKGITLSGCNGISIAIIKNDYGVLAHEIFHACTFILDSVGIEFSEHSEEAYAYLIGYLTQQYYNYINRLTV